MASSHPALAVREGARVGVLFRENCDVATVEGEIEAAIALFTESAGLEDEDLVIDHDGECDGRPNSLTVTAVYNYDFIGISFFVEDMEPIIHLRAQTVMRNE